MVADIRDEFSPFLEQGKPDAENITDENERRFSAIYQEVQKQDAVSARILDIGCSSTRTVLDKDLTEKSATKRCLEALRSAVGHRTCKEICDMMYPQIGGCTRCQARSVSMLLLRLSRHHRPMVRAGGYMESFQLVAHCASKVCRLIVRSPSSSSSGLDTSDNLSLFHHCSVSSALVCS